MKERLQSVQNTGVLEQEVFSHLANFFKRYYKDGDFISMRRYKKDVYAIPYEGEEVKLHWANHDQYYIKSSENFKNYSFKTPDGKTINFQLKEVSTEQNNNKIQGDAERRFAIFKEQPVNEIDGALNINFVYEPFSKATKQENLLSEALDLLKENIPSDYTSVFALSPTEKNSKRTLLEKHLNDYVSKNSFDYFIHKDLDGFLTRELDFFIKNEVLYLDDINTKQGDFFLAQLSKVKAIKIVAGKIITFLAQIENFQKKLWLKKKFVIRTDYCITLDKIPSKYYPEILQNKDQLLEWKTLFDVEIQSEEQLVFEQFLVLDTKFFEEGFKDRLLSEYDDINEQISGVLVNSDNFQALNLFSETYKENIDVVYIDPPYNTAASSIAYKNEYKDSSWLSLMNDRLLASKNLMKNEGIITLAIDDEEVSEIRLLSEFIFDKKIGYAVVRSNPVGRKTTGRLTPVHEYALFYGKSENSTPLPLDKDDEKGSKRYPFKDNIGRYSWLNFIRSGNNDLRTDSPTMYYPILVDSKDNIRVPELEYISASEGYRIIGEIQEDETIVLPIKNDNGIKIEKNWQRGWERLKRELSEMDEYRIRRTEEGIKIDFKARMDDEALPRTWWEEAKYASSNYGAMEMKNLFVTSEFSYPKSCYLVMDCLITAGMKKHKTLCLDYFGGSGTTGHATIRLNREDKGERKYILVEMGTYFNTVTKPRIQKVIYSDNWKNGKPQDKAGISQIVKYQVLESYEDTLNNLYLENKTELDFTGKAKEEYVLQYMLELESREHLFNLQMFRKPFDYKLKVTENNELKSTKVDLVETFNYLIGLYVSKVQRVKDIKVVEGTTRTGIKTLVIWRDLDTTTHDEVEKLLRRFYDSQRTKEFQQIYINGDHHLENLRSEGDSFKIKLIEETFFKKMFNETEL